MTDRHLAIGDVVAALMVGDRCPTWAPDEMDVTAILIDYTPFRRSRAENDAAYMRGLGFTAQATERDGKRMLHVIVGVCLKADCYCRVVPSLIIKAAPWR